MNKEVSFPIAKLLKEKGFDENCSDYYTSTGGLNSNGWGDIIYEQGFGSGEPERMLRFNYSDFNKHQKENSFLCPTIAEVVMWLYEKYGVWITSEPCIVHNGITNIYKIFKDNYLDTISRASKGYDSPTEAYEASIEYTLNNLI